MPGRAGGSGVKSLIANKLCSVQYHIIGTTLQFRLVSSKSMSIEAVHNLLTVMRFNGPINNFRGGWNTQLHFEYFWES